MNYENKILELLEKRDPEKTICPSEVLELADKKDKSKMDAVREAAKRLIDQGRIHATQKGSIIDIDKAVGPIRLKLRKPHL